MTILYETKKLLLEKDFEIARLTDKSSGKVLFEEGFYGEPECGLIDASGNWVVVGGEHLLIWTPQKIELIKKDSFAWIHALRSKNDEMVEILTDPWSDVAAIWELNIRTFTLRKIRNFDDYKGKPYTDEVVW